MGREVADSDQEINPKSPEVNSEVKDVECTSEVPQAEVESNLPLKPTSETAAVENASMNNPPQKTSNAMVEKEVCDSPTEVEGPVSPTGSNSKSSSSVMKLEVTGGTSVLESDGSICSQHFLKLFFIDCAFI